MSRIATTLTLSVCFVTLAAAQETILNSPHDLSVFGGGNVHATSESRVCIFCHVPHNASPEAPLWNRFNPVSHYRIYESPTVQGPHHTARPR